MRAAPIGYLKEEIQSYLPSGWSLGEEPGSRDSKKGAWSVTVRDGAEQDWKLTVKGAEAEKRGRLEALKWAIDKLYREALG